MKELVMNLGTIVGAVAVYFGVLILVPKLCKDKFIDKK
jgi:hypothetical protein